METQSDFERDIAARVDKVEAALLALSEKVDGLAAGRAQPRPGRPFGAPEAFDGPKQRIPPKIRRVAETAAPSRGVDWWLARAGAGLTVVAVILLYQYAVVHGWITPWVRVLTGTVIGGALMYWGRKMAPAKTGDPLPVALRELMMGAALAAWYITAFAASSRYNLIPMSVSRALFLAVSLVGGSLSLKERRSGLALIAVTAGFLGPIMLSDGNPSVPAYGLYIATLGGMSVILYLMRGWQSILWLSLFAISMTLLLPPFATAPVILTIVGVAAAIAYTRAPTLRRALLGTGEARYAEPLRSSFATRWLTEFGRLLKVFSPAAGSLDSASVWIITIISPLLGISFLSHAWPRVNEGVWGVLAIALATAAYRMCSSSDEESEITHVEGAAAFLWGAFGAVGIAHWMIPADLVDRGTTSLAVSSLAGIAVIMVVDEARFVAARAAARVIAGIGVFAVLFEEAGYTSVPVSLRQDSLRLSQTVGELVAIASGVVAWRDMRRRAIGGEIANVFLLASYGSLLLVDARVLGAIWTPLVTASFAIAGTTMLIMSRKDGNKALRAVGGATLALVMIRLFFVDMAGVDTIWRVVLFLGVGALFLFTSRQLQVARQAPSEST